MDAFDVARALSGSQASPGQEAVLDGMEHCCRRVALEGAEQLAPALFLTRDGVLVSTALVAAAPRHAVARGRVRASGALVYLLLD